MDSDDIKQLIETGIPGCQAQVDGDGRHFQAIVISEEFEGLSPLKKHQRVYQALGDAMQSDIHALSIQAFTPEEWEKNRDFRVL